MQTILQNLSVIITGVVAIAGATLCLATGIGWLVLLLKTRAKLVKAEKQFTSLCL